MVKFTARCFKTIYLNSTSPLLDIFSPNYPENYPKSSQCQWKIESDRNWKIAIYIRDFRLEAGYYSASFCNYDKLTIKVCFASVKRYFFYFCVYGAENSSKVLIK